MVVWPRSAGARTVPQASLGGSSRGTRSGLSIRIAGGEVTRRFKKYFLLYYSLPSPRGRESGRRGAASAGSSLAHVSCLGARAPRCGAIPPASPSRLPGRRGVAGAPPWCGGAGPARRPGGEQRAGWVRAAGGARRAGRGGGGAARSLRGAPSAAEPFVRRRRHVVPAPRARAGRTGDTRRARLWEGSERIRDTPSPRRFCPRDRLSAT